MKVSSKEFVDKVEQSKIEIALLKAIPEGVHKHNLLISLSEMMAKITQDVFEPERNTIDSFEGEFAFLSNFANSPIIIHDVVWPTVEHFYQAGKTAVNAKREEIRLAPTPGKAKLLGGKLQPTLGWNHPCQLDSKVWMRAGLKAKFFPGSSFAQNLIATGDVLLIGGNDYHDNFWGDCYCDECRRIPGKNVLGQMLMDIRDELNDER